MQNVVVAVPNTFTPAKVQQMKDCCSLRSTLRVHQIREADAVLMFYLWQGTRFTKGRLHDPVALQPGSGERVLIFDLGGGSANYTYAVIWRDARCMEHRGACTSIRVEQRLGFCLGGDHLDWEIARLVWNSVKDKEQKFQGLDPYALKPNAQEKRVRLELMHVARNLKHKLSASLEPSNRPIRLEGASPDYAGAFDRCQITAEDVLKSEGVRNRITELCNGLKELVTLCRASDTWEGVHTLIFTGRSTRFPGIQDAIAEALGEATDRIDLQSDAKTCVARGAAFWGMQQKLLHLTQRQAAFAHYGVARYANLHQDSLEFLPLIPAGMLLQHGKCERTRKGLWFAHNNGRVDIYQLMGADPNAALKDPEKYARKTLLGRFEHVDPANIVDSIYLQLNISNDTFVSDFRQGGNEQSINSKFMINDIGEDADITAKWLV
jgi:hypothetical protein